MPWAPGDAGREIITGVLGTTKKRQTPQPRLVPKQIGGYKGNNFDIRAFSDGHRGLNPQRWAMGIDRAWGRVLE